MVTDRQIVRSYHLLAGLYTLAASLIWGVNTLFLLDAGLSIGEVFVANAAFSAGMVVFEIPTGVVADTLGRRVSYLLSVAVLAATTIGYVIAADAGAGVAVFVAISVLMGLGFTFYSGALEAWLVDALRSVGSDDELDQVFARAQQLTGLAMLVGTTSGGLLGQIDLAVPFIVRVVLLVGVFALSWRRMFDMGFTPRALGVTSVGSELRRQTKVGITHGWRDGGLRPLMLAGLVHGVFFAWAFYAVQPYLLGLSGDDDRIWLMGIVAALMSLSTIAGNRVVEVVSRACRRRTSIISGGAIVMPLAALVMGSTESFWVALVCLLLITGSLGTITPVRQAYLHQVAPSEHRATVISFDAMFSSVGGVGGQVALGRVAGAASDPVQGFANGYLAGGLVTLLAVPLVWATRRHGGAADVVGGRQLRAGTCAARGLPRDAAVESFPREVVTG